MSVYRWNRFLKNATDPGPPDHARTSIGIPFDVEAGHKHIGRRSAQHGILGAGGTGPSPSARVVPEQFASSIVQAEQASSTGHAIVVDIRARFT